MQTTQLTNAHQKVVDEVKIHVLLGDLNINDRWSVYVFARELCRERYLNMSDTIFVECLRACGELKWDN